MDYSIIFFIITGVLMILTPITIFIKPKGFDKYELTYIFIVSYLFTFMFGLLFLIYENIGV